MIQSGYNLNKFINCSQLKARIQNGLNTFKWLNFLEEMEQGDWQMDLHMN